MEASHNPVGFGFAKKLNQGMKVMGVEIIQNNINAVGLGIQVINQITHGQSKISFGSLVGNQDMSLTGFGFDKDEQITSSFTLIFMIFPAWLTGFGSQDSSQMSQ